jgi:sulfite reductase (NADPH) hemoprotein beta-component
MAFTRTGDRYGWREDHEGNWHYTLFVEGGRVRDLPGRPMMTGLREIARVHQGDFRLTANQNLIIAGVKPEDRERIEGLLREHGLSNDGLSGLRRNAVACVALPTCGLSLAESERYLPTLIDALDEVLDEAGLRDDEIVIRMTGCPNGCARPFLAEIGLVGRGPGTYNLYLGAAFDGTRLNKLHRQDVGHDAIVAELRPLFTAYAKEREDGERFGNFVIRTGVVAPTTRGAEFHDDVRAAAA